MAMRTPGDADQVTLQIAFRSRSLPDRLTPTLLNLTQSANTVRLSSPVRPVFDERGWARMRPDTPIT